MENPLKFYIEPDTWVTGAELNYHNQNLKVPEKLNYAMVICSLPGKKYSFCVQVTKAEDTKKAQKSILKVNKNIIGSLTSGDEVKLLDYTPPIAKQVTMALNKKYTIPEGNWSNTIVNSAIDGTVLDFGHPIEFMYGTENPTFIQGIVKTTVPKAPAKVDSETIFVIEKLDQVDLNLVSVKADKLKEDRAKAYLTQLETRTFDLISKVRNESADKYEKTFSFDSVDPKSIYTGLRQSVAGFYQLLSEDSVSFEENFVGTLVAIPKGHEPDFLFEFQVKGNLKQGNVAFYGFARQLEQAKQISREWEKRIKNLARGMKEVPQAIVDVCQGCNFKLNIESQNEKGIVICSACNTPNILPIALRSY